MTHSSLQRGVIILVVYSSPRKFTIIILGLRSYHRILLQHWQQKASVHTFNWLPPRNTLRDSEGKV